tara:strand:- start:151 stop:387 length:237 start_codon:yes stop_codon:yes gene_type:complete
MQKIIFLTSSALILVFVIYLAIAAIRKGVEAKREKRENESKDDKSEFLNELDRLNEMYKEGALTKEEFEKAKEKLLEK